MNTKRLCLLILAFSSAVGCAASEGEELEDLAMDHMSTAASALEQRDVVESEPSPADLCRSDFDYCMLELRRPVGGNSVINPYIPHSADGCQRRLNNCLNYVKATESREAGEGNG